MREATEKVGINADKQDLETISQQNTQGLEEALQHFALTEVRTFLDQDVSLIHAVMVREQTSRRGYKLSISEIATLAGDLGLNYNAAIEFTAALGSLPLPEVKELMSLKVTYSGYSQVRSALESHKYQLPFEQIVELTQKAEGHHIYHHGELGRYLDVFSLADVKEILEGDTEKSDIKSLLSTQESLRTYGYQLSLKEVTEIQSKSKNHTYTLSNFLKIFKLEETVKLLSMSNSSGLVQGALLIGRDLEDSGYEVRLDEVLNLVSRMGGKYEYAVGNALKTFTLEDLKKILAGNNPVKLATNATEIQRYLKSSSFTWDIDEIINLAGSLNSNELNFVLRSLNPPAIKKFIDMGIPLKQAVQINNQLKLKGINREWYNDGIEAITTLIRSNLPVTDELVGTLNAGFSLAEICRFPFLSSKLIKKI